MTVFRWRVGDCYVTAQRGDDGAWRVDVTDVRCEPVAPEIRQRVLVAILDEPSSLRAHIWDHELDEETRRSILASSRRNE